MPTKTEMLANVRARLADASTVRFSDNEVKAWLLKGYQRVERLLQCYRTLPLSATLVDGQYNYNLSSFGTSNVGQYIYQIEKVWYMPHGATVAREIDHYTLADLNALNTVWPWVTKGTPTLWTMLDPNTVVLYPTPSVAGGTTPKAYIQGLSVHDTWSDGSVPVLSIDHQDLIEFWTCSTMLANTINDEGNIWRENKFGQLFWEGVQRARADNAYSGGVPRIGTGHDRTTEDFRFKYQVDGTHITGP